MRDLTPRQQENLRPIRGWIGASGLPSARAEIVPQEGFASVNSAGNRDFQRLLADLQEFVIKGTGGGVIRQGVKS